MSLTISNLQQVQEARRHVLGDNFSSIQGIEQQESVDSIFKKQENYEQRSCLYTNSADLKSQVLFSKILLPSRISNSNLQQLQEKHNKLQLLAGCKNLF